MEATGVIDVRVTPHLRYEWNGNPHDRNVAREAFQQMMTSGYFFATVTESPGKARQVRTFAEVEEIERERGTVTVEVTTALNGG